MANEQELDDFTKEELLALAEQFGVEVKHSDRKAVIVKAFEDDGVTVELIHGLTPAEAEDEDEVVEAAPVVETPVVEAEAPAEAEDEPDLVLVRMTRPNWSYEIRGYHFTREHPYGLVTEDDADYLVEVDEGFRMATPKEAREYYS